MDGNHIQNLRSDVVSLILSFIIFDLDDFNIFAKLLIAWATNRTTGRIKDVLERLDWDTLYQYHQHPFEVIRDQCHGFIRFFMRNRVDQTMFYNSVQKLFRMEDVNHHLEFLSRLSGNHFPSLFSFIFFKEIHRQFQINKTVQYMYDLLEQYYLRGRVLDFIKFLEDMYTNISERDYLLPVFKFCPNARNPDPIYQIDGHPLGDELWYSLCDKTVEANYCDEGQVYGKSLKMSHMWETECQHCKLQLIVCKILLSAIRD